MDNFVAIGAGLGLRALIDAVAHQTLQATALGRLQKGVFLNHPTMGEYPDFPQGRLDSERSPH